MMKSFQLTLTSDIATITAHNVICVTGTDTGIGKTVVTGLLAKELASQGTVVTQKWVQSGDLDSPDISTHDTISNLNYDRKYIIDRQVYSFNDPLSPHLAARLANQTIETELLKSATHRLADKFDTVLVETSGGIMVPLSESVTTGDLVADMKLPTIVVVPNKLGTINHSLLTMQYLTHHKVPIIGFIINQFDVKQSQLHADNPKIIHAISNQVCIGICSG